MAGVTGGVSYGKQGYGGGGVYDSYNNKNMGEKRGYNYGSSDQGNGGLGVYGDYSYGKSTLDKYKNQKNNSNGSSNVPDITGGLGGGNKSQTKTTNVA